MTKLLIPEAALKKHIAILGMNGSGKTSVAKSQIIEPALEAGERICNIDPTGVGWGLRLTASGKSKGYPVYIVGGDHADFPLFRRDGHAWAEIVGTSSDSFIFDTSAMTVKDRSLWFTDFAETLIRKNNGPLKLVLDEAHLFAPQGGATAGGVAPDMLHATNNLLALGRSKGLRITMISQRPAKLHKDSLTQAHSLIAMMLVAPQDRNAVKDWIADQADTETGKEIIASLPSLAPGEGWLWAPRERVLARLKFPRPHTFDSSSAPDERDGETVTLSPINPDAVKAKLATVAKETVANDPKVLRAEIAQLHAKLQKAPITDHKAIKEAEKAAYVRGEAETAPIWFRRGVETMLQKIREEVKDFNLPDFLAGELKAWKHIGAIPKVPPPQQTTKPVQQKAAIMQRVPATDDGTYTRPQMRILRSLTMWKALGHDTPSREMVAAGAGYAPGSGGFNNLIGGLGSAGAVAIPQAGRLSLAIDGIDTLSIEEGRDALLSVLSNPHKKLVAALNGAGVITRNALAEASGYAVGSGGFNNLIGKLNTLGISCVPQQGCVALSDWAQELLNGYDLRVAA